jgi:drug/metabolite transporter (DMT)-like permease
MLIGIFALLLGLGRWKFMNKKIQKISWKKFGQIALMCWPTLLGTGGFLYAVKIGPYGIASAVSAGGVFLSVILAHFLYHEKLSRSQLAWIAVTVLGIVGLDLVRGM